MHDRFDAQLREHLLATANTRPADGQLAALVEAVSRTSQRPAIAARLTWFPRRAQPVRGPQLRLGVVAAAAVLASLAAAFLLAGGPPDDLVVPTGTPFVEPTADQTATPPPSSCLEFPNGGAYGLRLGSLFLTMSIPPGALSPWVGARDEFELTTSCLVDRPLRIEASIVKAVYDDACDAGTGVSVATPADAVSRFSNQLAHTIDGPSSLSLSGFDASMFALDHDTAACGALSLWDDVVLGEGTALAYLVDVDGVTLGILLRFGDDPEVTGAHRDEAETMVYSIDIASGLAAGATDPPAIPQCIPFDEPGTYTADVGTLPLSITAPGSPTAPWLGMRDEFLLMEIPCGSDAPARLFFHAAPIDRVYADACHWASSSVDVATAAEAVAVLEAQAGREPADLIETTIGSYPATRFDISAPIPADLVSCDQGELGRNVLKLWENTPIGPGIDVQAYVAEIEGVLVGITASYDRDFLFPVQQAEIDTILASLRVEE